MKPIDLEFIRSQFPAFSEKSLMGNVFMENAGGSYMCMQVNDRLSHYYSSCKVQPYHPSPIAEKAGAMMDEAYTSLAPWINVNPEQIYFGPSTSQNTYVLSKAMMGWLKSGDEIIVTNQDHEANIGSWRRLTQLGIEVKEWSVDPKTGVLPIEKLIPLITQKTKLLMFPHCSNILGGINPVREICTLARENGVKTVVDGVSFAGHGLPDISALGCDVYLFSLYKVYGPHQGVMVISDEMSHLLSNQNHFFNDHDRTKRLLPAGPDHAQVASVKGVLDYFEAVYKHHYSGVYNSITNKPEALRKLFHGAECQILVPLLSYIVSNDNLRLLGPSDVNTRASTVSVIPSKYTPWELAKRLGEEGISCGAGHFYSYRLLQAMGIDTDSGVLRFSLVHYNSTDDVEMLINALNKLL